MKKLLLISNSICYGRGYLDHCMEKILNLIKGKKKFLFIPFASKDWDRYEKIAQKRFLKERIILKSIHHEQDYKKAVNQAKVIFVGGGNTFRLLKKLYDHDLVEVIKSRVNSGQLIYIGVSAGSNVACPTIKTTNDMPIVEPQSLKALSLITFQINPHYVDLDKKQKHKIETRDERLNQFHEENDVNVVGLKEGSYLVLENDNLTLEGSTGAKLFRKGKKPVELYTGQLLNFLL